MLVVVACSSGKGMCTSSSDREWLDCPNLGRDPSRTLSVGWNSLYRVAIYVSGALFFFLSYLSLEGM